MILSEFKKKYPWIQPRILATDIDSRALDKAQAGLFPEKAATFIPPPLLKKYFLKGIKEWDGWIKARSLIKDLITFEYFNLHKPNDLSWGPFDGIFCRNVLIYFLPRSQEKILEFFFQKTIPTGLLFLGHSELLFDKEEMFRTLEKTIYQKIGWVIKVTRDTKNSKECHEPQDEDLINVMTTKMGQGKYLEEVTQDKSFLSPVICPLSLKLGKFHANRF